MSFAAPQRVIEIMQDFDRPWCIAGGWALDYFLQSQTRPRGDVEIAIFRDDQIAIWDYLKKWELIALKSGYTSIPWPDSQYLEFPLHQVRVQSPKVNDDFNFDVMIDECQDDTWLYRRNLDVTLDIGRFFLHTEEGIPYLCPEIVLLYKTKMLRPKDLVDFKAAYPLLNERRCRWLYQAIKASYDDHPWLEPLSKPQPKKGVRS